MLQAVELDPSKKYPEDGGPDVARIAGLLHAVDEPSARAFARAVVANYLLGAPDAHGKNHSVLLVRSRAHLAPLYDVASGLVVSRGAEIAVWGSARPRSSRNDEDSAPASHLRSPRALGVEPPQRIELLTFS